MRLLTILVLTLAPTVAAAQSIADAEHVVVAGDPARFCGWPANNGVWHWGDEILVGFTEGDFVNSGGHNISGIQHSKFARSLDGGATWAPFDPDNFLDDENIKWLPKGKTRLSAPMDFSNPGFAMRVFATGYHGNDDPEGGFYYSYDRGAHWIGPHTLGDLNGHPELADTVLTPRTDYVVTGPTSCFLFISVNLSVTERTSRLACIKTDDGGLNFEFVSWITPAAQEFRSIMPQTVRLSNGDYLLACRKIFNTSFHVGLIDSYVSTDECKTWTYRSRIKEMKTHSNPPALVELADGRVCCIYGDRDAKTIAGRYSSDQGLTWGEEFVVRRDYQSVDEWADLGYPRLVQRTDGRLVAMYYWATAERPQQHIAASIWDPAPPPAPKHQTLFSAGMNGIPIYRIPALAVTKRGVVVAVCDARANEGQDLPNDIDLVMRRSMDSGETWTSSQVIADFGTLGCGDSSLLLDRETGRLWCFFTHAPDGVGVGTSQPGIDGQTFQLHLMYSDDDGERWSAPRNINADVKNPAWDAVWSSPGNGYQDDDGRLYFPVSRKSGEVLYSHFIFSDDHGGSWKMGGPAGERSEEWMLVQGRNGQLIGNMRNHYGKHLRAVATSLDRGATWADYQHHPELADSVCQACLTWYDPDTKEYMIFSNPADTERRRMTIKVSPNEGKSWPYRMVLHEGPAAYSSMAVLPDGQVGILYERGEKTPYESVVFAKFSLDWALNR
ncbi:MAG: exo-alpha-sialidase [Candidatus Hydrogenedentes bacterium]|nr:exo-alpha-sialidase [Candidatus Hydrogenedentota bacterium]